MGVEHQTSGCFQRPIELFKGRFTAPLKRQQAHPTQPAALADPLQVPMHPARPALSNGLHKGPHRIGQQHQLIGEFRRVGAQLQGGVVPAELPQQQTAGRPPRGLLLRELCWNHTTLQLRANAPEFTYQLVLLPDPVGPFMEAIAERWPGWVHWHLERVRQGGRLRWVGLLPFQWRGEAALEELNGALKAAGGLVFNAHVITVEDGGLGVVDADQVAAKRAYDPAGLCNPGKLRGWSSGAVEA